MLDTQLDSVCLGFNGYLYVAHKSLIAGCANIKMYATSVKNSFEHIRLEEPRAHSSEPSTWFHSRLRAEQHLLLETRAEQQPCSARGLRAARARAEQNLCSLATRLARLVANPASITINPSFWSPHNQVPGPH